MSSSAKKTLLNKLLMEVYRPYMVKKGKSTTRKGRVYRAGSAQMRDNRGIKYVVTPEAIMAYSPEMGEEAASKISDKLASLLNRSATKRISMDKGNSKIFYVSPRTGKSGSKSSAQSVLATRLRKIIRMKSNGDEDLQLVQKYLSGDYHGEGEPLIIGHTYGPGLVKSKSARRAAILMYNIAKRSPQEFSSTELKDIKDLAFQVIDIHKEAVGIDAHLEIDARAGGARGPFRKLDIAIPEPKTKNAAEGSALGRLIVQERILIEKMMDYLEGANLANMKGSNSLVEDIMEGTAETFRGRKAPKKRTRTNKKSSSKVDLETPVVATKSKAKRRSSRSKPEDTPLLSLAGLLQLKNLINLKLHDTLKEKVMGTGDDPVFLNYQTGRFAKSAQINSLTPLKGGLEADITWQHYPYDTFAPGGRLYGPARDPNFLIGQSIREILKEIGLHQLNVSTKAGR